MIVAIIIVVKKIIVIINVKLAKAGSSSYHVFFCFCDSIAEDTLSSLRDWAAAQLWKVWRTTGCYRRRHWRYKVHLIWRARSRI